MEQSNKNTPQPSAEPATSPGPEKPAKRQLTRNQKIRDFAIGFIGWWVVNGFLAAAIGQDMMCIALPFNVLVLMMLAFLRPWIALGILTTYLVNFVIALALGATLNGICWVPFTTPLGPLLTP